MQKKKKPSKPSTRSSKKPAKQPNNTATTPTPTATLAASSSERRLSSPEQQQFLAKLNQWLDYNRDSQAELTRRRNLETMNDYITLEQTVTEFLDTFLLIGYNLQGQRVIVQHCTNNRDQDALIELVRNIAVIPLNKPQREDDTY